MSGRSEELSIVGRLIAAVLAGALMIAVCVDRESARCHSSCDELSASADRALCLSSCLSGGRR